MGDKDASPFGYTFSGGFFEQDATFDPSQSLLTDVEHQSIANFFTNTDPFQLQDSLPYPPALDMKDSIDGFNNWGDFITPATVHGVSTTIPDQSQLHNNFYNDHLYPQSPHHHTHHLGNTHDDLQAASTLFRNSQSSYADSRSHDFNGQPSSSANPPANCTPAADATRKPLVITQHGLLSEQLAALIPNHGEAGTLDAQFAAQWAAQSAERLAEGPHPGMPTPTLKRSYTFGTDEKFREAAPFTTPEAQELAKENTRRMMRELEHAQPFVQIVTKSGGKNMTASNGRSDDDQSEEATSDEDEDQKPAKKRRKSKAGKDTLRKGKGPAKNRNPSTAEESGKKKRAAAAQKLQRENLSEEQKRSNHILSEQKRRNLIKRGFDDLHELVPEIRNGGLSKSAILTEAANFLENIIEENKKFQKLVGG